MIILLNNGFHEKSLICLNKLKGTKEYLPDRVSNFHEMIYLLNNIGVGNSNYKKGLLKLIQRTKNEDVYFNGVNYLIDCTEVTEIEEKIDMEIFECIKLKRSIRNLF